MKWNRLWIWTFALLLVTTSCRSGSDRASTSGGAKSSSRRVREPAIRRVICLFGQRPWLNADAAGDRDPEGIQFRVYLDEDKVKGVLRDGTIHVEMYVLEHQPDGETVRRLSSDWRMSTRDLSTIKANILGMGYRLRLRWAEKATAGHEIELITRFEDLEGRSTRAGTKRLKVPKYVN